MLVASTVTISTAVNTFWNSPPNNHIIILQWALLVSWVVLLQLWGRRWLVSPAPVDWLYTHSTKRMKRLHDRNLIKGRQESPISYDIALRLAVDQSQTSGNSIVEWVYSQSTGAGETSHLLPHSWSRTTQETRRAHCKIIMWLLGGEFQNVFTAVEISCDSRSHKHALQERSKP